MIRKMKYRRPLDNFKFILRKIVLLVLAVVVALPLVYMCLSSLFSPRDFNHLALVPSTPQWTNYLKVFSHRNFGTMLWNSIGTSVLAAIIRTGVVVLAAFALTHLRFRGRKLILTALTLTLFVPQDALLYHNYRTVAGLGLLDTWPGIMATSLFSAASMLMIIGSFMAQGKDGYDAARLDGASDLRYIWSILVPLSGPAVLTVMIQTLITTFNSYLWPLLVTNRPATRTIQIGITMLGFAESGDIGAEMAAIVVITLPFLVILAFTKKAIENTLIRR